MKISSKYLIGYLSDVIRQFVLVLPKMSGYIKTFKDKNKKIMSFPIDNDMLLENYRTIWTKIEILKNIGLNASPVLDHIYTKAKARTYGDDVYINFCGLNLPEGSVGCGIFKIILIASLLAYEHKYYLLVYFRQLCL